MAHQLHYYWHHDTKTKRIARMKRTVFSICALVASTSAAYAANITPYYLTDGDSSLTYEITNGVLTNTFTTDQLGYPLAVRDSIWLGNRDDGGATEFSLAGVSTGNTSAGGSNFKQLLDGAAGNSANYGVECCGGTNSVTIANVDWSNQRVLFDLGFNGTGVAYDFVSNSLFISEFGNTIYNYDLTGQLIQSFNIGMRLVGLAYETATDTVWGFNRSTNNLVQLDKNGAILQDVDIANFAPNNPFGGEMRVSSVPTVPEPAPLALLGLGLLGLGLARKRRG
tara:strand:- start:6773 stop:7615 length:843 start_codon:yes stop_codon:yes gene_type:complete